MVSFVPFNQGCQNPLGKNVSFLGQIDPLCVAFVDFRHPLGIVFFQDGPSLASTVNQARQRHELAQDLLIFHLGSNARFPLFRMHFSSFPDARFPRSPNLSFCIILIKRQQCISLSPWVNESLHLPFLYPHSFPQKDTKAQIMSSN